MTQTLRVEAAKRENHCYAFLGIQHCCDRVVMQALERLMLLFSGLKQNLKYMIIMDCNKWHSECNMIGLLNFSS